MSAYLRDAHNMDAHMNFRMCADDKAIIDIAAKLKGLKPQTYARQKLLESAKQDIAEMSQSNALILSNEDWAQFMAVMQAPVSTNEHLQGAIAQFNLKMAEM